MRRFLLVLIVMMVGGCNGRKAPAQTPRPVEAIQRVVIISVDGMRPDVILRADTPNLRGLMARGSFTFWAQTTDVAITLPSHVSMLTGCTPDHHGIHYNDDGPEKQVYPNVPTLFDLAHEVGYSTALCSGKSKFAALCRPGSVDYVYVPPRGGSFKDEEVAQWAAQIINEHAPRVLFVHFLSDDRIGHAVGWGTPRQIEAMGQVDADIGVVLEALKNKNLLDSTFILVSADHGGSGRTHGANDMRSRFIPWITAGPHIKRNFDLTFDRDLTVHTEDTFATVCWLMGIEAPQAIDGHPVPQIVEDEALQQSQPPPSPRPAQPSTAPTAAGS